MRARHPLENFMKRKHCLACMNKAPAQFKQLRATPRVACGCDLANARFAEPDGKPHVQGGHDRAHFGIVSQRV